MRMEDQMSESSLLDYFNGELSDAEEKEILEWKEACVTNRNLFEQVRKEHLRLRRGVRASLIKGDYSSVSSRISRNVSDNNHRSWSQRIFKLKDLMVAAVLVAAVSIVATLLLSQYFLGLDSRSVADIGAPAHTAILELSDGTQHYIGSNDASLEEKNGTKLAVNGGNLVYDKHKAVEEAEREELIYNKVTVPRGTGHYRVVLSDGSVVWLNSDSHLEYPVNFTEEERRVKICGEAYFEVARDEMKPFIVEATLQSISVLGTKFNVTAYPSESIQTTLVSGSVKVVPENGAEAVILIPGEQSVLDAVTGDLSVSKVSVSDAISWKSGITSIDNMSLSKILKVISRTYDVDFELAGVQADQIYLQGSIPNDEKLEVVLSVLSRVADVKFKMGDHGKIRVE